MAILSEYIGVKIQHEALLFGKANVADANGSALTVGDGDAYLMPYAGSVIAIAVRHNADLTGGAITWTPTVNGTAKTALSAVTDDTHQQAYDTCEAYTIPFAAGDYIGAAYTKTGTVAPTTTDASVIVRVVYHEVNM